MDRVRLGGVAGIGGALLFTAGWIAGGLLQSAGYSWSSQEISDLGALTAQHAWVWNRADSLAGALLLVFAVGAFRFVGSDRDGRIGAIAIGVVGVGSILDGFLREDCALSTSEACQRLQDGPGLSWHHQAHDAESLLVILGILVAPFAMARAFRRIEDLRGLYLYTLGTAILLVTAAAIYALLRGDPGGGIAQRVTALAFMAWIAVLGARMARERSDTAVEEVRPQPRA